MTLFHFQCWPILSFLKLNTHNSSPAEGLNWMSHEYRFNEVEFITCKRIIIQQGFLAYILTKLNKTVCQRRIVISLFYLHQWLNKTNHKIKKDSYKSEYRQISHYSLRGWKHDLKTNVPAYLHWSTKGLSVQNVPCNMSDRFGQNRLRCKKSTKM